MLTEPREFNSNLAALPQEIAVCAALRTVRRPSCRTHFATLAVLLAAATFAGCSGGKSSPAPTVGDQKPSGPWITATPNPAVPVGGKWLATTTIAWDTGDGTPGEVYFSQGGDPEIRFDARGKASKEIDWIGKRPCEFRLYAGKEKKTIMASVTVTRAENAGK